MDAVAADEAEARTGPTIPTQVVAAEEERQREEYEEEEEEWKAEADEVEGATLQDEDKQLTAEGMDDQSRPATTISDRAFSKVMVCQRDLHSSTRMPSLTMDHLLPRRPRLARARLRLFLLHLPHQWHLWMCHPEGPR